VALPDYDGGCLANLSAELELRLSDSTPGSPLRAEISTLVPDAATYVIVLFDGLGDDQLEHPSAAPVLASRVGAIDAVFPTTTSVNLASFVTALPPTQHGLIAHQAFLNGSVVNTLKWTTPGGDPVPFDTAGVLPRPNLWERLRGAGVEPITVQPGSFSSSPLSRALYRGCRFEPAWSYEELSDATVQLAGQPRRLILTYLPNVDVAAHVHGLESTQYEEALDIAATVWTSISSRLPDGAVLIGTADHGIGDYPPRMKVPLKRPKGLVYYGDPRCVLVRGSAALAERVSSTVPAAWVPIDTLKTWWGPGPHHTDLADRVPGGALIADSGYVLVPHGMDARMIGYHGGLDQHELRIPLLIG
jgi:hypothetical protein